MADRSEWAVRKTLDVIEVRIDMVGKYPVLVEATGRCRAKRDRLWTFTDAPKKREHLANVTTWVAWVVGAAVGDLPTTEQLMQAALEGRAPQDPLPGF